MTNPDSPRAYVTLDGSAIVELLHPDDGGPGDHSVALATVAAGQATHRHTHATSRELYCVIRGQATVEVGDRVVAAGAGDAVFIPAGAAHRVVAAASGPVQILCLCRPAYRHEDTTLLEAELTWA